MRPKFCPMIIARLDPEQVVVGRLDQREDLLLLLQRADHLEVLQREGLERLLAPVGVRGLMPPAIAAALGGSILRGLNGSIRSKAV